MEGDSFETPVAYITLTLRTRKQYRYSLVSCLSRSYSGMYLCTYKCTLARYLIPPPPQHNPYTISYHRLQSIIHHPLQRLNRIPIPPITPPMIQQPPRLLIIQRPTPNIITASNLPHRPARLPLRHKLLDTRRIRLVIRTIRIIEPKLRKHHRHTIHSFIARRAESIVPEPAFHAAAVCGVVVVVVQFDDEFVFIGEVGKQEFLAVAEIRCSGYG
jgi:hypothetical protein